MAAANRNVLVATISLVLTSSSPPMHAAPEGFLEGQMKIVSQKGVELDEESSTDNSAKNYADYPLVILSPDRSQLIARITPDENGTYHATIPAGDYILDVEERVPRRLRVRAQPFKVVSNETVHVDLTIMTGFGAETSVPQE